MESTDTIRQAVFNDEYVDMIQGKLLELPSQIKTVKKVIIAAEVALKYDTTVKEARQAVTDYEVEVAFEVKQTVWTAQDAYDKRCIERQTGKAIFTNEEQRKTETRRRLVKDDAYVALCNEVGGALRVESALRMDLGQAHARLAAIEAENHNLQRIAGMIEGLAMESTTTETHKILVRIGDNGNGDNQ